MRYFKWTNLSFNYNSYELIKTAELLSHLKIKIQLIKVKV